jgi:peptidoglycan/LPS O-acetylase OafA/YrhL
LFHHLWPWIWSHPALTVITRASHVSWIGVDLFFVLSGFLITGILLDSREKPGYFKNFLARRTLRIFPLYYFFLLLTLVLLPPLMQTLGHPLPEVQHQPWFWLYGANYLWLTGAFNPPEYLGITWSLAVEEQFYLVWPGRSTPLFSALGYSLLAVGLAGLLAQVIQLKTTPLKRIMRHPVLLWFGKYSYGIYLYHMLIWYLTHLFINAELKADGTPLHPSEFSPLAGSMLLDAVLRSVFVLAATCIVAWLSFRYFERYFLKLKKYF